MMATTEVSVAGRGTVPPERVVLTSFGTLPM